MAIDIRKALAQATALKEKEKAIKAEMKAQKQVIATQYRDGLSDTEKANQIKEAESILAKASKDKATARETFKNSLKEIKEAVLFAKQILDFVNYKQTHSLPHVKNQFIVSENKLTLKRDGISDITVDISKADWQKTMKAELKKQGINGEDRIADNIVYKAKLLVESNQN
jgi:hypothetical protein